MSAPTALAAPVRFEIPAQPAPAALMAFSKQARVEVVYSSDDLRSVRANAVMGEFEPEAALGLLLRDTGYASRRNGGGKFVVTAAAAPSGSVRGSLTAADGRPVEGVTVRVRETGASAFTDRNGDYVFGEIPAGAYTLIATAEGYQPLQITGVQVRGGRDVTISRQRMRRLGPNDDVTKMDAYVVQAESVTELDAFEVSDTRMKPFADANVDLPRTIDDPKAYYIFNATSIEQSGAATTEEFLGSKLTMMSNYGSNLRGPIGTSESSLGTSGSVSMRGLSSSQTLILVDGRRLPSVASRTGSDSSPDINSIPMGMIDRIEVLPSSASGIYGGGAVGGVVNIITKRNYTGGEIRLTYDNTFESDTAKRRVDLNYGFSLGGGRTRVMLNASHSEGNPMTIGDREDLVRAYNDRALANNPNAVSAAIALMGTTPRVISTNGAPLVLKPQYGGQSLGSSSVFVPAGYRGIAADGAAGLLANAGKLDPKWPDIAQAPNGTRFSLYNLPQVRSLHATVHHRLAPWLEMFLEGSYDQNRSFGPTSYVTTVSPTLSAAVPTNPFNQSVVVRYPYEPQELLYDSPLTRRRWVGGLSAKLPHDWQVLADHTWNRSSNDGRNPRSIVVQMLQGANAGTFDFFADPRAVPPNFSPFLASDHYSTNSILRETTVRATGPLPQILGIQPSLAVGLQWRRDERDPSLTNTIFPNNAPLNTGSVFLGASQEINAYYAELTLPLVSREASRPGLRLLELQLAGRRDEYTTGRQEVQGTRATFVSVTPATLASLPATEFRAQGYVSTNPTFGVRYKPVEDVMLRASFARGFLPPTADQLVQGVPSTFASTVSDPRRGGTTVSIIPSPVGGNPDLTPETSDNWSAGLVFTPRFAPGLRLAVDYTSIKKSNNIATLSAQVIVSNEAVLPGRVTRGAVPAGDPYGVGPITGIDTRVLNLFSTSIETYDVSLSYQKATDTLGTFGFEALATVSEHYLQRITLGAPELEYVGTPSVGGPLKLRTNLSATWTHRNWQTGWSAVYYDSYKVPAAPLTTNTSFALNNGGPTVPSQVFHDVFVRYRFGGAERGDAAWRRLFAQTELLVGVRNIFNKAPAFDGGRPNTFAWMSPFGDARLASYYVTLKRSF